MLQNTQNNQPMTTEHSSDGVRLPPITDGSKQTPGVTAGQPEDVAAGARSQNLMYRSVPPRPGSYTFTDMLTSSRHSRIVSTNAPSEYVERFKARPTQKPNVVAFDGVEVSVDTRRSRRVNGFFPPVKLRKTTRLQSMPEEDESPTNGKMHLVPTAYSEMRTRSVCSRPMGPMGNSRMTPDTIRTSNSMPEGIVYPNIITDNMDYDDLSYLPPPKRILPRREVPWVFRYKVKRNMNELAKIMASKPQPSQQVVDQAS